jgi:hypothetical protein
MVAASARDHGQRPRIDARPRERVRNGDRAHRVDAAPQPGWQDLLELREGADGRLLDPGHARAGRGAQPDGDRHRLLLVQQQRRQRRPGAEAIPAGHARRRGDRIAEAPEAVDVATDRARSDLEPLGELGAGPVAPRLQQRQQPEKPHRGLEHGGSLAWIKDRN